MGREFSVGVLDGKALPPIEIVPKSGFYDYANKYQSGKTEEICPARLDADDTARLQALAVAVHTTVRLGGYSRVDFILDAAGDFWCLEANTLPGMTPTSLLPQEAAVAGLPYIELCDKIVRMALEA
jgi:D-alanine-D-alanine ligase